MPAMYTIFVLFWRNDSAGKIEENLSRQPKKIIQNFAIERNEQTFSFAFKWNKSQFSSVNWQLSNRLMVLLMADIYIRFTLGFAFQFEFLARQYSIRFFRLKEGKSSRFHAVDTTPTFHNTWILVHIIWILVVKVLHLF